MLQNQISIYQLQSYDFFPKLPIKISQGYSKNFVNSKIMPNFVTKKITTIFSLGNHHILQKCYQQKK